MNRRLLYPLIALTLLSACATDIPAPTGADRVALGPSRARALKGTSNRIKPSDNGKKPGTGGSGSSTLEVSALLGKDGSTSIEASTGSLEDGTTNGTLSKMQLKLYALPDTFTANFTGLTAGYWTTTDARLERGDSVQAKGTVKPVGAQGTDNVTVRTAVHLRPDVSVNSLTPPTEVLRGIPAQFTAMVAELNGDRGARGDCILTIDGADVDHADGIWVDAGTEVACEFLYTFTTVGDHSVAVRVENVKPGDWDLANNSVSTTVNVVHPLTPIAHGFASIYEEHGHELTTTDTQRITGSGLNLRHTESHQTRVTISAQDPVAFAQPFQAVEASVFQNGAVVFSNLLDLAPQSDQTLFDGTRVVCRGHHELGRHATVCTTAGGLGSERTTYSFNLTLGHTTYYGQNIFCAFGFCNSFDSGSGTTNLGGNYLGFGASSTGAVRLLATDAFGDGHLIDKTLPPFSYADQEQHVFLGCVDVKQPFNSYRACKWFDRDGFQVSSAVSW